MPDKKDSKVEVLSSDEKIPELKNASSFYEKLRDKVRRWAKNRGGKRGLQVAEVVLLAPDLFILLVRLARDSRIGAVDKALIVTGITYFMTPIDILPEVFLGPGGFLDDIVLATLILNRVLNNNRDVVLEHWSGADSLLHYLQKVTSEAERLLGKRVFNKVNRYFKLLLKN